MQHRIPEQLIDRHHPIDDIEPEEKAADMVRDARVKCVRILNAFASHIESAMAQYGAPKEVQTAFWQSAYALGLGICEGVSVTQRAQNIGVERATLSKGMVAFCAGNDLPPSFHMKSAESGNSYREARVESIIRTNQ